MEASQGRHASREKVTAFDRILTFGCLSGHSVEDVWSCSMTWVDAEDELAGAVLR